MSNIAQELTRIQLAKEDIKDSLVDNGIAVGNEHLTNYCLYVDDVKPKVDINEIVDSISDTDPLTMIQTDPEGGFVTVVRSTANLTAKSMEWKKNNGDWTSFISGDRVFLNYGDTLQWRSTNTTAFSYSDNYRSFAGSGSYILKGDVMSMMNNSTSTLPTYCFRCMFMYFPVIETYVKINPSGGLSTYCCREMYAGCIQLRKAKFVISKMNERGYIWMFQNCVNLKEAPIEITATTTSQYCFEGMFKGCISLTLPPPQLPASSMASGCYQDMFRGCVSLKYPPSMNGNTFGTYCCNSMFNGCKSLVATPVIWNGSLSTGSLNAMFYGCSSLKRIYYYNDYAISSGKMEGWLDGIAAPSEQDGIVYTIGASSNNNLASYLPANIKNNFTIVKAKNTTTSIPSIYGLFHFDIKPVNGTCVITETQYSTYSEYTMQYCGYPYAPNAGGEVTPSWERTTYGEGQFQYTIPSGKTLWLCRCNSSTYNSYTNDSSNYITINIDATNCDYVEIDGDITALIQLNRNTHLTPLTQYAFYKLFEGQDFTKIRIGEKLMQGLRYLADSCMMNMFKSCTGLTFGENQKITFPAEDIPHQAYRGMFYGSSITSIPPMNYKRLDSSAMYETFRGCTSLTSLTLNDNVKVAPNATRVFYGIARNCTIRSFKVPKLICETPVDSNGRYFQAALTHAESLEKLEIPKCSYTAIEAYRNVADYCPNLTNIIIKEPTYLGAIGLSSISSVGNIRAYSVNLTSLTLPEGWNKIQFD